MDFNGFHGISKQYECISEVLGGRDQGFEARLRRWEAEGGESEDGLGVMPLSIAMFLY